jgi:AbrB family looped-hinge helix DNA binding protein
MDIAMVKSNGQITIPDNIRRILQISDGDKVLFVEENGRIVIENPNVIVLKQFAEDMKGAAETAGWTSDEDVVNYCKEIRSEMWRERYENNA